MIAIFYQTYLIMLLIAFAIGAIVIFSNRPAPLYFKFLPWFLLVVFVQEQVARQRAHEYGSDHDVCNIFLITNTLFYSFVVYQLLKHSAIKKWVVYAAGMFLAIAIVLIFFVQGINYYNSTVYFIGGMMLSFFSAWHLFAFFRVPGSASLFRSPDFWVACGILIFHSCTMPLILPWPLLLNVAPLEITILHAVLILIYCITYSMFAIGFITYYRLHKWKPVMERRA